MINEGIEISLKQICEEIVRNRRELRNTIEASEARILLQLESLNNRIKTLEKENSELKNKVELLDRDSRKNNLIIFGLNINSTETSFDFISNQIKQLINVDLTESNINNFYKIGKAEKGPIKLELLSILKKREILRNCHKLKGTKIYITPDLTVKQRNENKILREHLHQVKGNTGKQCFIKGNKLYVDNIPYTVEDLKYVNEPDPKNNSAPPTPKISKSLTLGREEGAELAIPENHQITSGEQSSQPRGEEEQPPTLEKQPNTPTSGTVNKNIKQTVLPLAKETVRTRLRSHK